VAYSSNAAPPLLVRTVRASLKLEGKAEYRVGRDPRADVELPDPRVSWDHATLYTEGATWILEDPGPGRAASRNGTYLNGERISRIEIHGETVIRFGNPDDGPVVRFEPQRVQPRPAQPAQPGGENMTGTTFLPGVDREPTKRLPLPAKVMRIGRLPGNDLVISDIGVSKNHAELRKSPSGSYQIIDLGSHNGTYVNGVRVNQAELGDDDIISIGHSTFRLSGGELREYVDEGNVSFEAHDLLVRIHDNGKDKILLQGITFPLAERSMLAVLGPAGAGKSTLLNALTGKRPATEGQVLYDFRDLYDSYDELKHRIGLVPQQSVTHDQLTARTALGYAAELRFPSDTGETERSQRVEEVLHDLDMSQHGDTRIDRLSGGQAKRVNIGLELLTKPSLLFLDEPTSPLDPHLKRELFTQMRKMADKTATQGQSVVVITHDVESKLIEQCDRIIVLVPGGKMAYFGPPKDGLKYFAKDDWADVFALFAAEPGRDWMTEYKSSEDYKKFVSIPMDERLRPPLPAKRRDEDAPRRERGRANQVATMARRYSRVMAADRGYLTFTILLPLVLGLLVRVMPAPNGLAGPPHQNAAALTKLLIVVMAACLSGMANAIREFIKEREIFERERMAGLSAGAYLMSKVLVLGVISVLQTLVIVIIGLVGVKMPANGAFLPVPPIIEIAIAVALLSVVAMLLGLTISTLVSKGDQTMPALVMLTMVMVVLSGGVFPLSGVAGYISDISPSRWGMGALASTIDMNTLNQTATPTVDALWVRSAGQWLTDMAVLAIIGLICLFVARYRLGKIGPRRRK
jgi:ABC-type multidrug transport system ATPase subunit/pSer/pThr/pTyr-binding forkhead associated (FHA) protein